MRIGYKTARHLKKELLGRFGRQKKVGIEELTNALVKCGIVSALHEAESEIPKITDRAIELKKPHIGFHFAHTKRLYIQQSDSGDSYNVKAVISPPYWGD
ncbi:hypothetical protein HOE04_04615 [archaeon]|jgi:hypothetical protein|nr:hypothetical protein [archaeon]